MSIQKSEIIWRHPQERSDSASNGGRMTSTAIPSGVKNSIWPDVPESERTSGSTKYRKVFIHIANDADLTLVSPRIFVETYTPGDDSITIFEGTQTDTQSSITGSEQQYGCGQLDADVSAGATSITVATEGAALDYFKDGMLIRISDKATVDSAGNEEYVRINGAPSYTGDVATITLLTALDNDYVASNTRVASVIEASDIEASYSGFTVTTAGDGDYDDTTNPVVLDHIATVRETWTLTFTDSTTFDIVGDTLGNIGSGNVSGTTSPTNPDYSKPYWTLEPAGFSGTWAAGDTIVFTTDPAAVPIWYKRIIPAGAASLTGDKVIVGIDGESA